MIKYQQVSCCSGRWLIAWPKLLTHSIAISGLQVTGSGEHAPDNWAIISIKLYILEYGLVIPPSLQSDNVLCRQLRHSGKL